MEPRRVSRAQLNGLRGVVARMSGLRRSQVRVRLLSEADCGMFGDAEHAVLDVRVTHGAVGVYHWSRTCHAEWSHHFVRRLARGFTEGRRTGARLP